MSMKPVSRYGATRSEPIERARVFLLLINASEGFEFLEKGSETAEFLDSAQVAMRGRCAVRPVGAMFHRQPPPRGNQGLDGSFSSK